MFYIFASFKQIWRKKYTGFAEVTVESDQGSKKKKKKKKKISHWVDWIKSLRKVLQDLLQRRFIFGLVLQSTDDSDN